MPICEFFPKYCVSMDHSISTVCREAMQGYYGSGAYFCCPCHKLAYRCSFDTFLTEHADCLVQFSGVPKKVISRRPANPPQVVNQNPPQVVSPNPPQVVSPNPPEVVFQNPTEAVFQYRQCSLNTTVNVGGDMGHFGNGHCQFGDSDPQGQSLQCGHFEPSGDYRSW